MNKETKRQLIAFLEKRHTESTASTYLRSIEIYVKSCPDAKNAKYRDVMDYLGELKKMYPNQATVHATLSGIKKYYDFLFFIGQRTNHPCKTIYLKGARKKQIQVQDLFTSRELELLLDREERYEDLRPRNKVVTSLLIHQGLTAGELVNLKLSDIDLDRGIVRIAPSRMQNGRALDLKPAQVMLFHSYLSQTRAKLASKTEKAFIINMRGQAVTADDLNYTIETMKGLFPDRNLNLKTIRMSVIANLFSEQGWDILKVQEYAGHKFPSSTEKYRTADPAKQRELINKFHPLG